MPLSCSLCGSTRFSENSGRITCASCGASFDDRLPRVEKAAQDLRRARRELRISLERARPHYTLEELGKAAGVTRQAVHEMLKQKEENRG